MCFPMLQKISNTKQWTQLSADPQLVHVRYHPDLIEHAINLKAKDSSQCLPDVLEVARSLVTLCWPTAQSDRKEYIADGHHRAIAGSFSK